MNKKALETWQAYKDYWQKESKQKETLLPSNFHMDCISKKTVPNRFKILKEIWPCQDKWSINMVQDLWLNDKKTFVSVWKIAYKECGLKHPLVQLMALTVAIHVRGQSQWNLVMEE
jgi:hypothetical protein